MITSTFIPKLTSEQKFMLSVIVVNAGNYLYNLLLGRILGPEMFADAALLITFLLVLSFVAMTFQLATAKFSVLFENTTFKSFISLVYKYAGITGIIIGAVMIVFAKQLQELFNTNSSLMFTLFGLGVPIYFIMSVNRGFFQGTKRFEKLAWTYQGEMFSRLIITLLLIFTISQVNSSILVVTGIVISFFFGLLPFKKENFSLRVTNVLSKEQTSQISKFFVLTAFYELTQIIINNSDILLVKHYFAEYDAGLYASLALIGRVVYFVTWMFVMLLLPAVIEKKKLGEATAPILVKYVGYVVGLASVVVLGCYLFPEFAIHVLFGDAYLSMAPLLWKYAIATALFAVSNIFAYYFLSLDQYIPVVVSGLLGISQILLIIFFHSSLLEVVLVQIIAMAVLLVVQLAYFFYKYGENSN
ncbi:Membrane protein involved in the export of O-antigen and teichoic acid [Aquimarina amphilecti]|uniref:Membrane protein involved in the export of O-antigen and teichoic acid n=2 Tax=Aquimarina amphilecti TaxID=1038014 RepID=A0A1H7S1L3_AQUAM|nr:Membrane protein involved in the export of O-antigen and teichoic acid [Aquimarina amphilecti]